MDADCLEKWFSRQLCPKLNLASLVMGNAPYHNRHLERLPKSAWRKGEIIDWLRAENIHFEETMVKSELLHTARLDKDEYLKYAIDELARDRDIIAHRLPPYHRELNSIEMILA
ncbi:hypothetical protein Trydic_g10393 [Trypoxylus dichotomus]